MPVRLLRDSLALLLTLVCSCGGQTADPHAGASGSDGGTVWPTTPKDYVLDFSASAGGGVNQSDFVHLTFNLDLDQPTRSYAFTAQTFQLVPGVKVGNEITSCDSQNAELLELGARNFDAGDSAFVEHVDFEIQAADEPWAQSKMCFGYRTPGGGWTWQFQGIPLVYDTSAQTYHARIPIQHGPIDAIKLFLNAAARPSQPLRKVTVSMGAAQ